MRQLCQIGLLWQARRARRYRCWPVLSVKCFTTILAGMLLPSSTHTALSKHLATRDRLPFLFLSGRSPHAWAMIRHAWISGLIRRSASRLPYISIAPHLAHSIHCHGLNVHRHSLAAWKTSRRTAATVLSPPISDDDTIYALSSAQGRAGIAVIRISGPGCQTVSIIDTSASMYID